MEISPVAPAFLYPAMAAALSVFLLLELVLRLGRKLKLPPGPRPLPIIGNLHSMGSLPHHSLQELSRHYGPLMSLRFGSVHVVVVSSADMARAVLKTHDLTFASRPKTAAGRYTTYGYSDIAWAPYGAYWRLARRICTTELFSMARLQAFEGVRAEEGRALVMGVAASMGRKVRLKERLQGMSFRMITRMIMGDVVEVEDLSKLFNEFSILNGVLNIGDYIPWLNFLDLQGYVRRMKACNKKMDPFLSKVIEMHIKRRNGVEGYVAKDMVDVLLQLADDPTLEVQLTENNLKGFIQDLVLGATETTAETIEWTMSELLRNPHVLAKAADELDGVVGRHRWVEEEDLCRLPYLESIVKESMRLHPVAPLMIPHFSREHCVVAGYDVPAGTLLIVNVWAIGRDPAVWEAPLEFRPERFNGRNVDVRGHDYELLPFGSGRRICPGNGLAMKVVKKTLANLVHRFAWRLPEGMRPEDLCMAEVFGVTVPMKVPLEAVAEPRLPEHLYA